MEEKIKVGKKVVVDKRWCKGCGICEKVCPFKAIEMVEEE